jgi:3-oxoacyl-[acyl-carrier-protein] synthase II
MSGVSPIGSDWATVRKNLRGGISGVSAMPEWAAFEGLQSHLAAKVDFRSPPEWDRKKTRTMGRVALMACYTAQEALRQAGLLKHPSLVDGSCGVAYGSTEGSPPAVEDYFRSLAVNRSLKGLSPYTYIQLMSHTCASNLSQFFKTKGRTITTCSACTSGSQGIGYAYEAIKNGYQKVMIAGGAEELHLAATVVFDIMYATSTQNKSPASTPRPFDKDRDGLVIGEGAGTLILEDLAHAKARGAAIYAELVGFGTNSDGVHIINPCTEGMETAMRLALQDAQLAPSAIGYVNAHGTATELGDIAETQATARLFGKRMPISSLKSYMGHTLGACGALEAWISIEMLREGWFAPTLNLKNVDKRCGGLDYIRGKPRPLKVDYVMSNNFAFGGVNTSLIFRRWKSNDKMIPPSRNLISIKL